MIFLLKFLSRLPLSILYLISDFLFVVAYFIVGYRRKIVYNNLKKAFPDKSEEELKIISKSFYKNFADVMVESLKVLTISRKDLDARVKFINSEILDNYIEKGESIIVMTGHQCNWEWLLISGCSQLSMPIDAVYKLINNPSFEKLMFETRSKFGGKPIEMQKAFREIVKRKNIPRCFAMVADQSPMASDNNLHLEFLNQDAPFFQGADRFAKLLKYPVAFMGMRKIKRGFYEVDVEMISEPPYKNNSFEILEKYRDKMESLIRNNPSDWLWSHKRWKHGKNKENTSN